MAIIELPTDFGYEAVDFNFIDFNYTEKSDSNGDEAERLGGPPRWACQLVSLENMSISEAGRWQSIQMKLRGAVNHLSVYDPVRTYPEGTMRGSPVLASTVNAGDTTAVLTASGTLKAGDLLQIGSGVGTSQLISVVDDAAPSGPSITINFEAPARYTFTAGTAVVWDHPRFYAKRRGGPPGWSYAKGYRGAGNFRFELMESW